MLVVAAFATYSCFVSSLVVSKLPPAPIRIICARTHCFAHFVPTTEDTTTTTVIKAGTAIIKGLDGADKYYLKEKKAPEGYNILTEQKEVTMENKDQKIEVEIKAGAELPSTGGIGTTIFYILGAILVIGAGVVLVTRRRMSAN